MPDNIAGCLTSTDIDLPWLDNIVRAKRLQRLPVVLTPHEVRAVLNRLDGIPRLMAWLLYGTGLRVLECCRLRMFLLMSRRLLGSGSG